MSRILVPPEVLIRVSDEAGRAAEELERTKNLLDQQITWMISSWEGTTRSRFFEDFQRAHGEMNKTIEHLRITSQELKTIAFRFIQADMRMDLWNAASAAAGNAEPKNFWDHAGDFWEGLQTGAMSIANSVKETATSLVDDPVGTVGDMAYNATIGTVEEIVDTAVWGGKMIFDADTREKFAGDVEDAGGTSNFIGQQAAMVLGGLATRRFGVKGSPNLKHDSGGDGGKSVEGTPKARDLNYAESGARNISPEEFFKEEAIAEEMYDKFRDLGTKDVEEIAKNTGFPLSRVQRIKDHVFNNTHIKDHGIGKFDPDYELAQAWERLMNGKYVDSDIQLLHHEIFESKFEGIFKTNYRTAHDKAIESGRTWDWEKNYEE